MKGRFCHKIYGIVYISLIAFFFVISCVPEKKAERIVLPESAQLSFSMGYAVVLTNYIRIRATPAQDGIEITALARGAIVTVLDKGHEETIRDVTDFWYQIDDGRNRGWLFGAHAAVFHEKSEAEAYGESLKEPVIE